MLVTFGNKAYTMDPFGYLEHPGLWDENFADGIAPRIGISSGLNDDHWRVIRYLRQQLEEADMVPYFVSACVDLGYRISRFRELFPTGFMRGACRAAGISFDFIASRNLLLTYENLPSIWTGYALCPMGFLRSPESWDRTFVNLVAKDWDLPAGLTEVHWQVIHFLRERYQSTGKVPLVYETCRANKLSLEGLNTLFPTGYWRGACRIAGLPFTP